MFGKSDKNNNSNNPSIYNNLLEGTLIKGDLRSKTDLRIDGELQGNLFCEGRIVIGDKGQILGNIQCKSGLILGQVSGNIQVEQTLELRQEARIVGDINTARLIMEEGVRLEGHCLVQPKAQP